MSSVEQAQQELRSHMIKVWMCSGISQECCVQSGPAVLDSRSNPHVCSSVICVLSSRGTIKVLILFRRIQWHLSSCCLLRDTDPISSIDFSNRMPPSWNHRRFVCGRQRWKEGAAWVRTGPVWENAEVIPSCSVLLTQNMWLQAFTWRMKQHRSVALKPGHVTTLSHGQNLNGLGLGLEPGAF